MSTTDRAAALVDGMGGIPFISDTFQPAVLLALTARVRRTAEPDAFPDLADYLDPDNAQWIFERHAVCPAGRHDWVPLGAGETAAVAESTKAIQAVNPHWSGLFSLPMRIRKLVDPLATSSSCTLQPQTIYLGRPAFTAPWPLEESLIHEHAHIWLNCLAELSDLQTADAPGNLTLPSGTSGKNVRGVLLAAHFAGSALRYYTRSDALTPDADARRDYLRPYLTGCLETLDQQPGMTPMGQQVQQALETLAGRSAAKSLPSSRVRDSGATTRAIPSLTRST